MISYQVVPDAQVPPEASQVLDGLGSQLLLPSQFNVYLLIMLFIGININELSLSHNKSNFHILCAFVFEPEK